MLPRTKYKHVRTADKEKVYVLIKILDKQEPLSAAGFFQVDKSLFVSVVSTIITYLIILCQFKL